MSKREIECGSVYLTQRRGGRREFWEKYEIMNLRRGK